MPEVAEQPTKPPRTWRPMVAWTLGILAALGLAWFVGAVAVPVWKTRGAVDRCFSASLSANGLWARDVALEEIERLGGREAAVRRLSLHLRLPEWLALNRVTATMMLSECGPKAVPALIVLKDDKDSIVRQTAAEALEKLRAKPAVTPSDRRESSYIYLQPLGASLPDADVAMVKKALTVFYGWEIKTLPRVDLPESAYYPPRKRYRAEKLLDFLKGRLPGDGQRIVGLTAVDISTTKGEHEDWGILGLATLGGEACVFSMFRAKSGARDAAHARERLAKVAVHETGHTFGLEHCPQRGCIMEDAKGKVSTTDREYDLCPACRAQLKKRGYTLPANPEIPWPKPQGENCSPTAFGKIPGLPAGACPNDEGNG